MIQQFHVWVFIKENRNFFEKDICTPMIIVALFIIAKI